MAATTALVGCDHFWLDSHWRSGKFVLIAIDAPEQMMLIVDEGDGMSDTLVGPAVYSIGADDSRIVIKQHPNTDNLTTVDRSIIHYFIVDRAAALEPGKRTKAVRGPLDELEFARLTEALSLPPFTKTFKELE